MIDESDDLAPTEVSNNFCIEGKKYTLNQYLDDDFETISPAKHHHAKVNETPFNFEFNQTERSAETLPVSDFAMVINFVSNVFRNSIQWSNSTMIKLRIVLNSSL